VLGNIGAVDEFSQTLSPESQPVVYLCTGRSCRPPTTKADDICRFLGRQAGSTG